MQKYSVEGQIKDRKMICFFHLWINWCDIIRCLWKCSTGKAALVRLLFTLDRSASGHGEGAGEACRS